MVKKASLAILTAFLLVISFFGIGCSSKSVEASPSPVLEPHRTEVYFLIENTRYCGLLAYIPEGSVCVSVKVVSNTLENRPYIEVARSINEYNKFLGPIGEPYVNWGLGGTLYVKDIQQVKDLLLSDQWRD